MVAQQEYTVDNKRRQRRMEQLAGESEMQRQIEEVHWRINQQCYWMVLKGGTQKNSNIWNWKIRSRSSCSWKARSRRCCFTWENEKENTWRTRTQASAILFFLLIHFRALEARIQLAKVNKERETNLKLQKERAEKEKVTPQLILVFHDLARRRKNSKAKPWICCGARKARSRI